MSRNNMGETSSYKEALEKLIDAIQDFNGAVDERIRAGYFDDDKEVQANEVRIELNKLTPLVVRLSKAV